AEPNIDLFLNHHAYRVETENGKIVAVEAFDTRTSQRKRFRGRSFADCTGHGTIGYLAGADWEMTPKGRMGMSNMWIWEETDHEVEFPETPWALDLTMKDFPYPRRYHGEWFWESGFDKDPIREAEAIRDWNFRAVYGAFNAMKNRDGRDKHRNARLVWIAFIGGPRESRRLMGDVVLTEQDVVEKKQYPDGCVPSTWSIDLHYPKKQFAKKYPDNPFISMAKFDRRVDRTYGYPIPYRCFYSRNVDNLFMAGRCISVTHEALGTVRVMKTCGMMGEVVGKAASICAKHYCTPREVYTKHWKELESLLQLPGKARRKTVNSPIEMPSVLLPARPEGPMPGLDPETLPGIVVDDRQAEKEGPWTEGQGLKGFVGYGYLYAPPDKGARIRFTTRLPSGRYDVRLAYRPHPNRGTRVPVTVKTASFERKITVDMQKNPPLENGFISLGQIAVTGDETCEVVISTENAAGIVHADAVWFAASR
ncbi:MAG TPA: FAD-dependent oxidoreductase, partial [Planctomycetaceae bacterium]|nr:FAD-dependent oxidoreductase [Planctomycetaceae bacterium]